jgi:hypothetical protein
VAVTVNIPKDGSTTLTATTAADGTAAVKYTLKARSASGTYQVQAVANKSGIVGSNTTNFSVP